MVNQYIYDIHHAEPFGQLLRCFSICVYGINICASAKQKQDCLPVYYMLDTMPVF